MGQLTKDEIIAKKKEIEFNTQLQYAIKIIINSIYGAFGSKYFYFHNRNIAQSITRQGKHLIKFSIAAINHYFENKWHLDYELHEKLGLSGKKINKITKGASIYADTDSTYCDFSLAYKSIDDFELSIDEQILFCKHIVDYRFEEYLNRAFETYAKAYNTENFMNFALESISYNGIWVAKKNYTIKVGYEKYLLEHPELVTKGLENKKPSHPGFARNILTEFIDFILDHQGIISLEQDIIPKLKEYRKKIEFEDVDNISAVKYLRTYNDYIKDDSYNKHDPNDVTKLDNLPDGTPINNRAALYYNYFRDKGKYFKYQKIMQGNQVRIFYAKHDDNPNWDIFAYLPKQYPYEFAFKIDYDTLRIETMNEDSTSSGNVGEAENSIENLLSNLK